jgi:hypothetical protein
MPTGLMRALLLGVELTKRINAYRIVWQMKNPADRFFTFCTGETMIS